MRGTDTPAEAVVIDASALIDLLADLDGAQAVHERLRGTVLHAPSHLDAEVLSALGRLSRAGELDEHHVEAALDRLAALPVHRHSAHELVSGAWARRGNLRLVDALYVELAHRLRLTLLTTDNRLDRACGIAEAVTQP